LQVLINATIRELISARRTPEAAAGRRPRADPITASTAFGPARLAIDPCSAFADERFRRANGTAEFLSLLAFNPARAAKFPTALFTCAQKRCAAQAEYLRLAAQAYSPSDAMSQAIFWSATE
jgi:hypothetical protein